MDPVNDINVAVVGFGKLGLLHASLFNGMPGCQLSAIVDSSKSMLNIMKAQIDGLQVFSHHRDLIKKQKPDAVVIATPTKYHTEIACDFIKANIPILIEKPLSTTKSDAKKVLKALEKNSVPNMVAFMSRYTETFRKTKEIISSNALGNMQKFKGEMYIGQLFKPGKGWRYSKESSGGGVLITQNSHLLDLLLWFFGDVSSVNANCQKLYSSEVEDAVHAQLHFNNGLSGWIDTSWSERHHRTLSMNIHIQGQNGTLTVNDDEIRLFLDNKHKEYPAGWSRWRKPDLFEGVLVDVGGPHYSRQALDFINALKHNKSPDSDIYSAFKTQCLIDAVYQSSEQGGNSVKVEYK